MYPLAGYLDFKPLPILPEPVLYAAVLAHNSISISIRQIAVSPYQSSISLALQLISPQRTDGRSRTFFSSLQHTISTLTPESQVSVTPIPVRKFNMANPEWFDGVTAERTKGSDGILLFLVLILFVIGGPIAIAWSQRQDLSFGEDVEPLRLVSPLGPYLESTSRQGQIFPISNDEVQIGRAEDCDIVIGEDEEGWETVSDHHAVLEKRESRWVLIDGGKDGVPSMNGIFVNGRRTRQNYLANDFLIGFGSVILRFHGSD